MKASMLFAACMGFLAGSLLLNTKTISAEAKFSLESELLASCGCGKKKR